MTDLRWAQQPHLLERLSDDELQKITVEVLMAVHGDKPSGHYLGCRCSGIRDIDGPRVTCGDLMRVVDEQRRRRRPKTSPRYVPDWQGARVSDGEWTGGIT